MKKLREISWILCLSLMINIICMPQPITAWAPTATQECGKIFNLAIKQLVTPGATIDTYDETITSFEWTSEDISTTGIYINNTDASAPIYARLDGTTVKLYSDADEVILYQNWSHMFHGFAQCQSIDLSKFNTSNVNNMSFMFNDCSSLSSLDLSRFNTTNVKNMSYMFWACNNLTSLDLSSFNTQKVTNMQGMFEDCSALTTVNLSSFNTSNVSDMEGMFYDCSSLTSIDLSSFNTSAVTNMYYMFYNCSTLAKLDINHFDLSNIEDMNDFIAGCNSLTYLKMPASLQFDYITLPVKNDTAWTDENGLTVTECLADNIAHTYKRNDYIEPAAINPASASIELTATQETTYTISVPALISFTQDLTDSVYDEPFHTYDLETGANIDNYGTYYAECDIEIDGYWGESLSHIMPESPLNINVTPPTMTGTTHNVDLQMWEIHDECTSMDYKLIKQVFPSITNEIDAHWIRAMYTKIIHQHYSNMPEPVNSSFCGVNYNSAAELDYLQTKYLQAQQIITQDSQNPEYQAFINVMVQNHIDSDLAYAYLLTNSPEAIDEYCSDETYFGLPLQTATISNQNKTLSQYHFMLDADPASRHFETRRVILRGQFDHPGTYSGNLTVNFSLSN